MAADCWIVRCECGMIVALMSHACGLKECAKELAKWIRAGLNVEHIQFTEEVRPQIGRCKCPGQEVEPVLPLTGQGVTDD